MLFLEIVGGVALGGILKEVTLAVYLAVRAKKLAKAESAAFSAWASQMEEAARGEATPES